jgi:hypothetical protein
MKTLRLALPFALLMSASLGTFAAAPSAKQESVGMQSAPHDFDFLVGKWHVRHHRLKARLQSSHEWEDFNGSSALQLTMNGYGTLDDNVIELPAGTYRAVTLRSWDPASKEWAIWWLDGRYPTRLDPPMHGNFANGVGTFYGDDTFDGKPIRVRFLWTDITRDNCRWQQAFSTDGGKTWETNWVMQFTRDQNQGS